jgi:hypothetical protein
MQQQYNGLTYYLLRKNGRPSGYVRLPESKGGRRVLHRDIYSGTYGNIPHGWHVHHMDGNVHNNVLENLKAMPKCDHDRLHQMERQGLVEFTCIICRQVTTGYSPIDPTLVRRYCSPQCRSKHDRGKARHARHRAKVKAATKKPQT